MKQILIKFDEGISDEEALQKVLDVVCIGKISKNGTAYCSASVYDSDETEVHCSERTKYPTFWVKEMPPVPSNICGNRDVATGNDITKELGR